MLGLLAALLALALAYFAGLDGWYLARVPCAVLRARLLQPRVRDLLAEQRHAGRVLPSDLDLLLHMNNARYLREADVARAAHLARCGVLGALRALGAHAVLAASCARYRRSLRLFEPFEVEPPELPEDLRHWIAYNEASSQLLRAESGLGEPPRTSDRPPCRPPGTEQNGPARLGPAPPSPSHSQALLPAPCSAPPHAGRDGVTRRPSSALRVETTVVWEAQPPLPAEPWGQSRVGSAQGGVCAPR
ncbi:protein THEM6 isoform X2 [Talpa occidentalis]|uniref:protein THEM6 isoform X2 n=1 Tax=Talpa occidentalis TaxID=50954 RepID=UPI00188E138D|nr:protein THEM6 isoform X2 [Talpa occidentalis]